MKMILTIDCDNATFCNESGVVWHPQLELARIFKQLARKCEKEEIELDKSYPIYDLNGNSE